MKYGLIIFSHFHINQLNSIDIFYSKIPRLLFKYSINLLDSAHLNRFARRLATIPLNSGLPIHHLTRLFPRIKVNQIERVGLPLNLYTEYVNSVTQDECIKFAFENLAFWTHLSSYFSS